MSEFANWLLGLLKDLLKALWDFITDILIEVLDLILVAVLALIAAIPAPAFVANFGATLAGIDAGVWFFASHFRLAECFAVLGAGFAFRLARKAMTLFQW